MCHVLEKKRFAVRLLAERARFGKASDPRDGHEFIQNLRVIDVRGIRGALIRRAQLRLPWLFSPSPIGRQ